MRQNQQGFSAVELFLVAAFIGITGFVGWTVYERQDGQNSQSATTQIEEAPEEYQRTTTVPDDWKTFENGKFKLSFSYPSDWTVREHENENDGQLTAAIYPTGSDMPQFQIQTKHGTLETTIADLKKGIEEYNRNIIDEGDDTVPDQKITKEEYFRYDGHPAARVDGVSYVEANDRVYQFTGAFEDLEYGKSDPNPNTPGRQTLATVPAKDVLTLFESIKIQ